MMTWPHVQRRCNTDRHAPMPKKEPYKKLDLEQVEKLAAIGCTVAEIAAVMNVNKKTLERRCMEVMARGRLKLNASVKRQQIQMALEGNPTMLIWVGKQYLGQHDSQKHIHSGPGDGPIQYSEPERLNRLIALLKSATDLGTGQPSVEADEKVGSDALGSTDGSVH